LNDSIMTNGRRRRLALALATAALLTAPAAAAKPQHPAAGAAHVTFGAPAGNKPAGQLRPGDPFDGILPSGRIMKPVGRSAVIGGTSLGVALSPDDRYAIVATAGATGSLVVVDTATLQVVGRRDAPAGSAPFAGVAAMHDPADPAATVVLASAGAANGVSVFDLGADGSLTPDAVASIAVPPPRDARFANDGRTFVATIVPARDGAHAFVIGNLGNTAATVDVASRTLAGPPVAVGFQPFGAAATRTSLLVADEGLIPYGLLATKAKAPLFAPLGFEPGRSSSLSVLPLGAGAALSAPASVQMDPVPDGMRAVGGAHPSAVVATPNGKYAFVAMTGVDRIATVALGEAPAVVGGTELRLYNKGPYGTQPAALAMNRDGSRLYVALEGIDAVAVLDARDPVHLHRLGLIPTGWQPTALALSRNGHALYVVNARGALWPQGAQSTLQRVDLTQVDLLSATRKALSYQRVVAPVKAHPVVPQMLGALPSPVVKHVVLVLAGNRTFDAMLGDVGAAAADPSLVLFGQAVTPNLHALAKRFALAANFYSDADQPGAGDAVATAGIESAYTMKLDAAGDARRDLGVAGKDPEDYPRLGYVFDALAMRHATYRDYGALLRVSGSGAGGTYALDVPSLAALAGNVDERYPGYDPRISDVTRAQEFARDYASTAPAFAVVWLPSPEGGDEAKAMADQDRALGTVIDAVAHGADWASTAVFVTPDGTERSGDHIDSRRSYALVVSPYARRGYVGMRHLSTASMLKTEEELLGLPALSLGDALASDMRDFFVAEPDPEPYSVVAGGGRSTAMGGE
jgi:DNA-binding beta-propeller fold protein YncE